MKLIKRRGLGPRVVPWQVKKYVGSSGNIAVPHILMPKMHLELV